MIAFAAVFWLALASRGFGKEFAGKVIGIHDGDTLTVLHDATPEKVRLDGIDCPELGQSFWKQAKWFASDLAFGRVVTVRWTKKDRYGRILGDVTLPDGRSLNQELVRAGLAWWYRKFSRDERLGRLEEDARQEGRGLWRDPHPVPPWEWRRLARKGIRAE